MACITQFLIGLTTRYNHACRVYRGDLAPATLGNVQHSNLAPWPPILPNVTLTVMGMQCAVVKGGS